MEDDIEELAKYIINEIEKEDFFEAMRHYGKFKVVSTANKIRNWWEDI